MKTLKLFIVFLIIPFHTVFCQDLDWREGKLASVNNTRLFVKVIGEGEPIIVIHGGPVMDQSYLLPHLKALSKNYQLIFFDQRLSGRSSVNVDTADIKLDTFVDDIEALRKILNLDKAHIMGHSWGGLLAMKYALRYPDQTATLILSNSMPPSFSLWQQEQALVAESTTEQDSLDRQEIMQSGLLKTNPPEAIKQLLLLSFKNQFYNKKLIEDLNLYVPDDYMYRSALFGNLMPELSGYDLIGRLKELKMPVLVIYGSAEPAGTLSGPVFNEQIPDSKVVIIEKSGHFPFIEQPETFNDTVQNFLERN